MCWVCIVSGSRGRTSLSGIVLMYSTSMEAESGRCLRNTRPIHAPSERGQRHQKEGPLTQLKRPCQSGNGAGQTLSLFRCFLEGLRTQKLRGRVHDKFLSSSKGSYWTFRKILWLFFHSISSNVWIWIKPQEKNFISFFYLKKKTHTKNCSSLSLVPAD